MLRRARAHIVPQRAGLSLSLNAQSSHWHPTLAGALRAHAFACAQAGSFFGAGAEGAMLAELGPGGTLLLPGSWPHAVVTQQDSLVVGGNFLHALDLRCV